MMITRTDFAIPCGCAISIVNESDYSLRYCALHSAAPELLAACKAALEYIPGSEVHQWPPGFELKRTALSLLRESIKKAKGEPK